MSPNLNESLNKLRLQNTGCDVVFEIDSQSFSAHRVVLMARQEQFENMFAADMRDKKESVVLLDSQIIDPVYFGEVLNYIYTSKIDLSHSNIRPIHKIANYFCFDELISKIKEYIKSSMTIHNVSLFKNIAIQIGLKSWKSVSSKFKFSHIFTDIHRSYRKRNIPNLSLEDFNKVLQKLKETERLEDMFHYSVDWVLHDQVNRSLMLPELLKNIPLNELSFYFLTKVVPQYDFIMTDRECRSLLLDAVIYYNYNYSASSEIEILFAIGGKDGEELSSISEYNSATRTWIPATPMPYPRTHFDCAVIDHKIYICGGNNGHANVNELTVYDTHTRRWTRLTHMKHNRQTCGVAALNGKIYVAGGFDGTRRLTLVERYCLATDRWEEVAPMIIERSSLELVALNGFLYAIGRNNGRDSLNSVERYDPQADLWVQMNDMNNAYSSFGATVWNNKIYLLGGHKCEVYSPLEDKWNEMPTPSKCGFGRRLAAYDGKLYAIGGRDGEQLKIQYWKSRKTVETFDFQAHVWRPETDMDVARCFHRVAVVEV